MPNLLGLGRKTAIQHLRRLREMAASIPAPQALPTMRTPQPRQRRRTLPRLPAGPAHRRSELGRTSWHGFAEAIVKGGAARGLCNDVPIDPITTAEYPLPAKRPGNSVMSNERLNHAYKLASRHWLGELNLSLDWLSAP